MILWLVRHPEVAVAQGTCYGSADVDLKPGFEEKLGPLVEAIKSDFPALIFSSPRKRCKAIAERVGPATFDCRLAEISFGQWELRDWSEIPADELMAWERNVLDFKPPQGESVREMHARVADFCKEALDEEERTVCLIGHGGVIRTLLCILWHVELQRVAEIHFPLGAGLRLQRTGGHPPTVRGLHNLERNELPRWMS